MLRSEVTVSIWTDLPLTALDGAACPGATFAGKVVLVVNVASRCGLTPQYAGLERLAREWAERGVVVLGVPCNQFAGQEPGTAGEIAHFCSTTWGVTFPMLEKQEVNGPGRSELYRRLVGDGPDIGWNFAKFLVGRTGEVVARFSPTTAPEDPALLHALGDAVA
jgi:glutathione peroxidase